MKLIPNWPDYFADKRGNIYSMKPMGAPGKIKLPTKPRKLKPAIDSGGYHYVSFYRDKKHYTVRVGRLILETFRGSCPESMECCHGITGPRDDSLKNLSWGTHKKNAGEDRLRDGTDNRGEKCGAHKLNRKQVLQARLWASKIPQVEIAKRLGISKQTVCDIFHRRSWAWLEEERE